MDHRLLRADAGQRQDGAAQRELPAGRLPARHHRPPHPPHPQRLPATREFKYFLAIYVDIFVEIFFKLHACFAVIMDN